MRVRVSVRVKVRVRIRVRVRVGVRVRVRGRVRVMLGSRLGLGLARLDVALQRLLVPLVYRLVGLGSGLGLGFGDRQAVPAQDACTASARGICSPSPAARTVHSTTHAVRRMVQSPSGLLGTRGRAGQQSAPQARHACLPWLQACAGQAALSVVHCVKLRAAPFSPPVLGRGCWRRRCPCRRYRPT